MLLWMKMSEKEKKKNSQTVTWSAELRSRSKIVKIKKQTKNLPKYSDIPTAFGNDYRFLAILTK